MKQMLILMMICISASLFSQIELLTEPIEKRKSVTVGFM